jgi:hypothetical protein
MTNNEYTTRELNLHFAEIKETLARIEAQTIRTNGRVTKCESDIIAGKTSGKIANWAFGLTVPLILGMAVWIFFNQLEEIRTDIHKHDIEYQKLLDKLK